MGQAKHRGTFEERRAAAIERNHRAYEERVREVEIEGRKLQKHSRKIAPYISMAALMGHGLGGIFGSDEFWGSPKKKNI
jgi:hypothetical protein